MNLRPRHATVFVPVDPMGVEGVVTGGGGAGELTGGGEVVVVVVGGGAPPPDLVPGVGVSPPVVIPVPAPKVVPCVGVSPPDVTPVPLVVAAATAATVPGAVARANPAPSAIK